jgi:hypothetical protein
MAAMTTALTEFADNGNSRTSILAGHTASKPRLIIEKRVLPAGDKSTYQYSVDVVYATTDADGMVLSSKVVLHAQIRAPINGDSADVAACVATFRDVVAGDEFGASVTSQGWLSP